MSDFDKKIYLIQKVFVYILCTILWLVSIGINNSLGAMIMNIFMIMYARYSWNNEEPVFMLLVSIYNFIVIVMGKETCWQFWIVPIAIVLYVSYNMAIKGRE